MRPTPAWTSAPGELRERFVRGHDTAWWRLDNKRRLLSLEHAPTVLPRRYDAFLFLNETRALQPLHEVKTREE
jgi:hypothetical protein